MEITLGQQYKIPRNCCRCHDAVICLYGKNRAHRVIIVAFLEQNAHLTIYQGAPGHGKRSYTRKHDVGLPPTEHRDSTEQLLVQQIVSVEATFLSQARPLLGCARTRWLTHNHQSPMTPASVTSPTTWPTSCFLLRPNWYRAL